MNNITPKVAVGGAGSGLGGAASIILVWLISQLGVTIPPEVAAAISALVTGVFGFVAAYLAPHSEPTPDQVTKILQTTQPPKL